MDDIACYVVSLDTQMNFHGVFHWARINSALIPKVIPTDYALNLKKVFHLWWYEGEQYYTDLNNEKNEMHPLYESAAVYHFINKNSNGLFCDLIS